MNPWAVVNLSWEHSAAVGPQSWAPSALVRDEAALQPGPAYVHAGGWRDPSSPEPKPEQSGLISKMLSAKVSEKDFV